MNSDWKEKGFYHEIKNVEGKEIKRIKTDLLLDGARGWAKKFVGARPELKSTQIRKFYHDVKALEAKISADEGKKKERFEQNLPLIKMLKSKVAYACPEKDFKGRKVPKEFKEFMDKCIDGIKDPADFEAFTLVFEAVVGYFFGEGGRQS